MSNKLNQTVIGIDIGSSTAKIAAVQRGAIDVITNQANFRQTPVVVGFGDGQRKIGQIGYAKIKSNFKNTIVSPIRYLGLGQNIESAKRQLNYCPCETQLQDGAILFKVNANGIKEQFTSEQITAAFLTQLSGIINHNNLDDKQLVIAVPSYFTEIEKKSLLNAAEISGAKNVKLITDTVAIALDYGTEKKSQFGEGRNVVFVDFGYSKLSLSLVNFAQQKIDVLLQKSNRNLGCRDIDQKIFQYVAKKFKQTKGLNLVQNKKACLKLAEVIQRQRKILSGISETQISIECLMEDQDLTEPFTRQIMAQQANQVFTQISNLFLSFKLEIEKLNVKIDSIQLVGGGSRIPKFIETVQSIFDMSTSRTINSSETIARGATIAAVLKSGLFRFHSFNIINRSAHKIKIQWKTSQDIGKNEIQYPSLNSETLIDLNTPLPFQKIIKLNTNKAQVMISYELLDEQIQKKIKKIFYETQESENTQISIQFNVNEDGFVKIEQIKNNAGQDVKYSTKTYKLLNAQQISKFKAKQRQMFVKDFAIVKGYQKKNQLESFIYKQKQLTNTQQAKRFLLQEEIKFFQNNLQKAVQKINESEQKLTIQQFQQKRIEIQNSVKQILQNIKQRKTKLEIQLKKLFDLKSQVSQALKQISQRFRNTNQVVEVCNQIKQIQDWAQEAIKVTKSKQINELPAVNQKDIDQQHQNIKILINELINPKRSQPQPRQFRQQKQQPQDYLNHSYHSIPQHQQQRRRQQSEYYDPFSMSHSGFFRPNNMFGFF